jgi:hypothetical protein
MKAGRLVVLVAAVLGASTAAAAAATLGIGSWHVWSGSQTLTKATCTIPASGITDTYVNEASPNSSFGSSVTTAVRSTTGQREWTFILADLSSCALPTTGGADSATLKLVVKTVIAGGRTLTITPVLAAWSGTLTAVQAAALPLGGATTTFATGTTNGATLSIPVTVDVDALIKNPTALYGWAITDAGGQTNTNATIFNSAQATTALRPQLVVNGEK